MKILFLITKSTEGGAQTHITQLARALIARGDTVAVMSAPGGWLEQEIIALGATFYSNQYFANSYNPLRFHSAMRRVRVVVDEYKPDIVSCHSGFAGFVGRAAIKNRVPTLFTAHGWSFSPGAALHQRVITWMVECYAARWCRKILCVSQYDCDLARRYHVAPASKLITVHNGVEIPSVPPVVKTSIRSLVFIGRLVRQKRPLDVLEAVALLPEAIRQTLTVTFVGGGPLEPSLKVYAVEHGIEKSVQFLGNIHRTKVLDILSTSDVLLLPTNHEGLPRSMLEALAHGVPVMASGVAGIPEIIQDEVGYILHRGHEPQEMAEYITRLWENPDLVAQLSVHAYHRAINHFSLEKMIAATCAVYDEVINA